MYDGLPVLRKWITIDIDRNPHARLRRAFLETTKTVVVDSLNYEMLRAPNMAPEHMTVVLQQANNPAPLDQQVMNAFRHQ